MAILGVDDMKAKLVGGGARPNLFKVTMGFPSYVTADVSLASYMCKAASLPASTIAPIPVPFRGRQLQIAGDRTFEPWNITVINDTSFTIRNAFERWMDGINSMSDGSGEDIPGKYQVLASVSQLDRDAAVTKTYNFKGMWPTTLSNIDLSAETNDALETFEVTLRYDHWEAGTIEGIKVITT